MRARTCKPVAALVFAIGMGVARGEPAGQPPATLHLLAAEGRTVQLRALVDGGAPVDAPDNRRRTALHWAVIKGEAEAVALLLDLGADPNAPEELGATPLHWAAMKGHWKIVPLLVRRGARVDARNVYGMTPLHESANADAVRTLVEAGANVNAVDDRGMTPLHLAQSDDVATALLARRADLRIRAKNRRTAMEIMLHPELIHRGLVVRTWRPSGRLKAEQGTMELTLRNISEDPLDSLEISFASKACTAGVIRGLGLAPGQREVIAVPLRKTDGVAGGEYPMVGSVRALGKDLGSFTATIDTREQVTLEDQGMIRLGKVTLEQGPPVWHYIVYAAVPLAVVVFWVVRRRRS